jgi:hypothetical protein
MEVVRIILFICPTKTFAGVFIMEKICCIMSFQLTIDKKKSSLKFTYFCNTFIRVMTCEDRGTNFASKPSQQPWTGLHIILVATQQLKVILTLSFTFFSIFFLTKLRFEQKEFSKVCYSTP